MFEGKTMTLSPVRTVPEKTVPATTVSVSGQSKHAIHRQSKQARIASRHRGGTRCAGGTRCPSATRRTGAIGRASAMRHVSSAHRSRPANRTPPKPLRNPGQISPQPFSPTVPTNGGSVNPKQRGAAKRGATEKRGHLCLDSLQARVVDAVNLGERGPRLA